MGLFTKNPASDGRYRLHTPRLVPSPSARSPCSFFSLLRLVLRVGLLVPFCCAATVCCVGMVAFVVIMAIMWMAALIELVRMQGASQRQQNTSVGWQ